MTITTTPKQAVAILTKLHTELVKRQDDVRRFEAAYRGEFALKFASDDFAHYFGQQYEDFSDNWTQVVADAPHERLEVTGIRHSDEKKGDKELWDRWLENECDHYSDLAFLDAIIAKRSYALVWGNRDDEATVTWEHPSQAIVSYDPETRKRSAGAKIWQDDDLQYATLYLPDSVWKFSRARIANGERPSGLIVAGMGLDGDWQKRHPAGDDKWPMTNPLGAVPLVEMQNKPRLLGEPLSDIEGTLSMQHAINLVWAQLFTGLDTLSLPGRVVTGAERPTVPVLNEDGQEIGRKKVELKKIGRDRIYWLEDPLAKIHEWSAGNFEVFTKVLDKAVGHVASRSRTPATYFMGGGSTIANVGDKSMLPLETGLVGRTGEKTQSFGRGTREVFRLMALAEGETEKAASIAKGKVLWRDIETRSEAEHTDALAKKASVGYPFRYLLELDGVSDPEIDRIMEMVKEERDIRDPLMANILRPTAGTLPNEPGTVTDDAPNGA